MRALTETGQYNDVLQHPRLPSLMKNDDPLPSNNTCDVMNMENETKYILMHKNVKVAEITYSDVSHCRLGKVFDRVHLLVENTELRLGAVARRLDELRP